MQEYDEIDDYLDDIKEIMKKLKEIESKVHPMSGRHVTECIFQLEYYLEAED